MVAQLKKGLTVASRVSDDSSTRRVIGLSQRSAQRLHLHAQGLLRRPSRKARVADVDDAISRMALLQIDTIHVVARSPYLVLFSRLGGYPQGWLDDALADGRIAECWAHEACFVPVGEYRYHRDYRPGRASHWALKNARRVHADARGDMEALLERIRREGPVRAADFERGTAAGTGWWGWKPEKRWLEAWFALGELMVSRRERFQRVYDLASRVTSRWPEPPPTEPLDEATIRRHFILASVRALGIAKARWIADYFRLRLRVTADELAPLVDRGDLIEATVDGWNEPAYVHRDHAAALDQASLGRLRASRTTLLSPFDPVVWDRDRARDLFGFDYSLECYVPAPKRRYGYYVLPILHRGHLIGRLDAKAHRQEGVFRVNGLWLEAGVEPSASIVDAVAGALRECAAWHGTPRVVVARSEPRALARRIAALLRD
ncbi:crosslink repair DNA glycosylase YcaQ family protein [Luteibacter sp. PPL201]|uniref:Crosslink repair DNA glycosylase YcaQ family protein n=1 Tax=Luteibacter sahnii TaxID=3021977 RepID=A0ABT6BBE5_9GAMM|nr:crosslink repair DNA glycosylase YcaQ family protein [Luteibacter sp. PPL193]MDY1547388.1 crosslink repair DNA glycosylase YcaQ family protein [Luteibacter sp. PPL193]